LPPLLLAFYACFIRRRKSGSESAAVRWTELTAEEVLQSYGELFGYEGEAFGRVRDGLQSGMTKEWFEQKKAALNKALRAELGPVAYPYLLQSSGSRPVTRFLLDLPAASLRVE
jgi:hypothetical protein